MELFLFIVAILVLASLQEWADLKCLKKDYQEWKHRRK
jgi:hypothetical protein